VDRVGLAALLPGAEQVLPSLWEAVAGTIEVTWGVRDEETGKFSSFTPEMAKVWAWKDELPAQGLACVGKHLGSWVCLVAPRLVPSLHAAAAERRGALDPFQLEVAEAVREAGPSTPQQLRSLLGAEKKTVDAAVYALQRALMLTNARLVAQDQGWGAIAVDLVERRFALEPALPAAEARRTLASTLLAAAGEVSAADAAGALGLRRREARELLDDLVDRGLAEHRREAEVDLWQTPLGGHRLRD
jgi:DNA-binding MarR family transcriptional regulator